MDIFQNINNIFSKIYFSDCIKMWEKTFENKKKKKKNWVGPGFQARAGTITNFFFMWPKFTYILSLDYKRPKSEPNSPVAPT
jgi:hypothetical protein